MEFLHRGEILDIRLNMEIFVEITTFWKSKTNNRAFIKVGNRIQMNVEISGIDFFNNNNSDHKQFISNA